MKIHFLGCGDAFGSGERNQSAYLIETTDRLSLLDCGPTTLPTFKRAGFDPLRLDTIILSHLHGDHCGGLPFFLLEYLHNSRCQNPLHLAGPPGTGKRIIELSLLMFGDGSTPKKLLPTKITLLQPEREEWLDGIQVFPFRVPHQVNQISLGLKITYEGKQILYSGDSAWTDLFLAYTEGVDLFICECSFFEENSTHHMDYDKIKENLHRLRCKQLVLTHMGEDVLARRREIMVKTAEDGMVMEI
jgi:ribonuclease BN (tRNA processing enzyme)